VKRLARHRLHAALALCALLTLALILWPRPAAPSAQPPARLHYAGDDFQAQPGGRLQGFVLTLSSSAAAVAAPSAEPLPVLVGIVGRSAYLRSVATGEITRVPVGQDLDGWRLVSVGARAVTLRGASGDRRVELFAAPPAAPEGDAPPTTAPSPVETGGG
jgi:hypothetical protein